MHQWDRDTSGRLQIISTPIAQVCEFSVHTDTMDPLPEEQQSQPGTPMNPTAYTHPVEGYYFQVQGAHEETAHHRGRFRRKLDCGFVIMMYYMY